MTTSPEKVTLGPSKNNLQSFSKDEQESLKNLNTIGFGLEKKILHKKSTSLNFFF